jgi:hypothetical protein
MMGLRHVFAEALSFLVHLGCFFIVVDVSGMPRPTTAAAARGTGAACTAAFFLFLNYRYYYSCKRRGKQNNQYNINSIHINNLPI